jgi:hypothetical protein
MNNKGVVALLVGLVILFGLILTCPNKDDHKIAVVAKITEAIKNDSINANNYSKEFLGGIVVSKIIEVAADNILSVNNYFVFSLGTIHYNGDQRVVSFGILHHVFCLFSKKDLEDLGENNVDNVGMQTD